MMRKFYLHPLCAMLLLCMFTGAHARAAETPAEHQPPAVEQDAAKPIHRPGFFALPKRQGAQAVKAQPSRFHSLMTATVQQRRPNMATPALARPSQARALKKDTAPLASNEAHKLLLYVYEEVR